MDESIASWTIALLIVAVFFFLGYMVGNTAPRVLLKRRSMGVVAGESVEFVLDDIDYTIGQDSSKDKNEKMELSAHRYVYDPGVSESIRVSVTIPAHSEIADTLHAIYKSRAIHVALSPFKKAH